MVIFWQWERFQQKLDWLLKNVVHFSVPTERCVCNASNNNPNSTSPCTFCSVLQFWPFTATFLQVLFTTSLNSLHAVQACRMETRPTPVTYILHKILQLKSVQVKALRWCGSANIKWKFSLDKHYSTIEHARKCLGVFLSNQLGSEAARSDSKGGVSLLNGGRSICRREKVSP